MAAREIPERIARLTRPVVRALAACKDVRGVLCFGSLAMGTADRHSDVDLYVFCRPRIPPQPRRRSIYEALPALSALKLNYSPPDQWWPEQDKFRLRRRTFDLAYNTTDWVQTVVSKVLDGAARVPELRHRPHKLLGLLDHSIALHDPDGLLAGLSASLYPYPERLRERLIAESLSSLEERLASLLDIAHRGIGNSAFLWELGCLADALLDLLFAINRRHAPATRRPEQDLRTLDLLPPRLAERYEAILIGPFDKPGRLAAIERCRRLIEDARKLI